MTALQAYTVVSSGGLCGDNLITNAQEMQFNRMQATLNSILISRQELFSRLLDRRRNIDEECGHNTPWTTHRQMGPQEWQDLNDWDPIASTINALMANEAFQVPFEVYEDEDPDNHTEFEGALDELPRNLSDEPSYYAGDKQCVIASFLKTAWIKSGIGRHGVILYGFDDISPGDPDGLSRPVKKAKFPGRKLLYLKTFSEVLAWVSKRDTNPGSPRYGKPEMYSVSFGDPTLWDGSTTTQTQAVGGVNVKEVHYTRILHITHTEGDDPYYCNPECQQVMKPIQNLQKIYGADGEGRWKMAFTSLSFETTDPETKINIPYMKNLIERWQNGLEKAWALEGGITAKTIAPSLIDPTPGIEINLRSISINKRIPKRVLEGTERGEQASGQDEGEWNERVKEYQTNTLLPRLLIPFYDRLINVGCLPIPKGAEPQDSTKNQPKNGKQFQGTPFRDPQYPILNIFPPKVGSNGVPSNGKPPAQAPSSGQAAQPAAPNPNRFIPSPRKPGDQRKGYRIHWPDIASQTDAEKADIATKIITALGTYIEKQVDQVVPVREMLVGVFRGLFTEDEVDSWLDAAEAAREAQETMAHKQTETEIETKTRKVEEGLEMTPQQEADQRAKEDAQTQSQISQPI